MIDKLNHILVLLGFKDSRYDRFFEFQVLKWWLRFEYFILLRIDEWFQSKEIWLSMIWIWIDLLE